MNLFCLVFSARFLMGGILLGIAYLSTCGDCDRIGRGWSLDCNHAFSAPSLSSEVATPLVGEPCADDGLTRIVEEEKRNPKR